MSTQEIKFPVNVNGKKLIATAEEDHTDPIQRVYNITFSDGYQDDFLIDEESGTAIGNNKEKSKLYARGLSNDLHILMIIDPIKFYHIFQENVHGINTNVWVIEDENDQKTKVYVGLAKLRREECVGKLYPYKTKEKVFLDYYIQHFNSIEYNASHYKIYGVGNSKQKAAKAKGKDFLFCPKMFQGVTH